MDLYLNIRSTDLVDINHESSYTASKVFGHMLSMYNEWKPFELSIVHLIYEFEDILLKLMMHSSNHIEHDAVISSGIIESITHILNATQDLTLQQDILRLLINMIEQS
jgi:hypothetical protein